LFIFVILFCPNLFFFAKLNMNQSAPYNFYKMSKIPMTTHESLTKYNCFKNGTCVVNIDGKAISGGRLVSSGDGFQQPSLGFTSDGHCSTFPLFFGNNAQYTVGGDIVVNNTYPLYKSYPQL
jgi:hypothetical protein